MDFICLGNDCRYYYINGFGIRVNLSASDFLKIHFYMTLKCQAFPCVWLPSSVLFRVL